jgi:hypothetical protein
MMMMVGTLMTQIMTSQILMNSSLLTTVVGLLAPGTVELIVFPLDFIQCLVQHFHGLYDGCAGVLQDISRLYSMKNLVLGERVSPLTILYVERLGRKHRECSLRPWYANYTPDPLFHSYLLSLPCVDQY